MMKNKNQQKTRHLIFYILVFYLISTSVTCYKYTNKIQESNNKNLFF